jgi:WD40 repeat protein
LRKPTPRVPRLVLVLGSSGSGKSSLVRAGLIPRLKKDEKNWLPLRPFCPQDKRSPLDALASAIADTYKDLRLPCDGDLLRSRLRSAAECTPVDSGELLKIARELASAADRREATVLVTVDQAEELLNSGSLETGKSFLRFLGASLSDGDRHLMAVATLRSDSLGVFQNQVASLDSACRLGLEHRPLTVAPIPIERYPDLIEGPARLIGLDLEDRLVLKLLQDAGQPDSLPLLAFTLRRLYDLHFEGPQVNRDAKLTLREYEELGGLAEVVQNAADRIFEERQHASEEIKAFREALIPGLIRYNEDRSSSRRRAFLNDLPPQCHYLLSRFVDERLLVRDVDKQGGTTLAVAHEALLRTWRTLITWLEEDRDKLRQYNAIERAAQDWDESGRKSYLLVHRDELLKDATELISERRFALLPGPVEHTYLDACITNQQMREAAAQEERERRLRDAQKLRVEHAAVEGQARIAESRRLASESSSELTKYPQRSLLLAVEAAKVAVSVHGVRVAAGEQALREALAFVGGRALVISRSSTRPAFISADNHWLVTGSDDRTARLWDLKAKDPAANPVVLSGHEAAVTAVAISADNRWLVTGSHDRTARLWDLTAKDPAANPVVLRGHEAAVTVVAISADNRWLVTNSPRTVRLWDLRTKDSAANSVVLRGHEAAVTAVAISADNRWLLTGSYDFTARVWDLTAKNPAANLVVLRAHENAVNSVGISPDNHWLVTGSDDRTARLWDLTAKDPAASPVVLRGHENVVAVVGISPDNHWLVTGSHDRTARLWDLTAKDPAANPAVLRGHENLVTAVDISPDNHWLVTGSSDSTARLWDLRAKDQSANPVVLRGHEGTVFAVTISADNHWLLTGSRDKTARLWDVTAKDPAASPVVLRGHENVVTVVGISPDNHWLVTGSHDRTARLWDLTAKDPGANPAVLRGHEGLVVAVAISPDNHWLVTGSWDTTARLWDLRAKDPAASPVVLRGHESKVAAVGISPDNHWLVTGSSDSSARLWDLTAKDPAAGPVVLRGHENVVNSVGISPDNHWLVTGSDDRTARLWDLRAKDPAASPVVLRGHKGFVKAVSISADNHWLVSGSWDGTARLWPLQVKDLIDLARVTVGRNLSASEWQLYFPGKPYQKTFPDLPGP